MAKEVRTYLSIGSNMGNKLYYIIKGLLMIDAIEGCSLTKVSSFYETEPWGNKDQDKFYNIAVEVRTTLLPFELLRKLQDIETKLERIREVRWGPRTLDIDIVFYDDLSIETDELILPHKLYSERKFVLAPLYEVYLNKEQLLRHLDKDKSKIDKVQPKVLVSSCLVGENCTYRGDNNKKKILDVINTVKYIKVCPEVLGGLETPRIPAEISGDKVITKTGEDVTSEFEKGAFLTCQIALEHECDLAIMKSNSPSCGSGSVYDGTFTGTIVEKSGVTSKKLENKIKVIAL